MPSIPKLAPTEELDTRQHFLSFFNAVVATESLARQVKRGAPASPAAFALVKVLLQPLWTAFSFFAAKRIHIRKLALKGCSSESTLVQKLVSSDPLSKDLFDQETVEWVIMRADRQVKSVLAILQFRPLAPKRPALSSDPRTL